MSAVPPPPGAWVVDLALVAIIGVWCFTIVEDAFNPRYDPPSGVTQMCMLVAGFLVGGRALLRPRNGDGPEK